MNIPGPISPIFLNNLQLKIDNMQASITKVNTDVSGCTACSQLSTLKELADINITKDLDEFKKLVENYFADQLAEITKSLGILGSLIIEPGDLGGAIDWIKSFIHVNILDPYDHAILIQAELIKKQIEMVAKIATITSQLSGLEASITSKISELSCDL